LRKSGQAKTIPPPHPKVTIGCVESCERLSVGVFLLIKVISVKGKEGNVENLLFKKWFVIFVVCCTQFYLFLV